MSIRDYFNKKNVLQNSVTELTKSVESPELVKEVVKRNKTFYPNLDFSDPESFVHFGSAEEYYRSSIERIYSSYPYDGSEAEKLQFKNNSTYLDQWLLDNKYPKSTGYALFSANGWGSGTTVGQYGIPSSKEYIYTAGGLHTASVEQHTSSQGIGTLALSKAFDKGTVYDPNKNRTINYRINPLNGITIQFWMKKQSFGTTETDKEVILDLWNGNTVPIDDGAIVHNYGRLTLELSGGLSNSTPNSVMYLTLQSGSKGIVNQPICLSTYNAASLANNTWTHHTVTIKSKQQKLFVRYFQNGLLNSASVFDTATNIEEIPGKIDGYIGALSTSPSGSTYAAANMLGAGKLSASLDDFRYWKKDLTDEYIYNTWYYPVGGGSNSDDFRTDLGVYYKFNEGIVGSSSYDSVVLDYSGRVSNGRWVGYDTYSRSTGTAFTQKEPGDPIIRSDHPSVKSLVTEMARSGSIYDKSNSSNLYNAVPSWLREEDEQNSNIKYLHQILSSYLDTLYVQIGELPKLKDKNYYTASAEPYFFVDRLLNDQGLITPNSFIEGDVLEYFWDRSKTGEHFEQNIEKTKRLIYNNIYNNLEYIYKTKGTEKSFRNLLRCYGVDDELIKLNVYTDYGTHYLKDRYKDSSVKTKVLNFNKKNRTYGRVIQTSSSANSFTFISGSGETIKNERFSAFSMEGGFIFPRKLEFGKSGFYTLQSVSASLFGFHQANSDDSSDYSWHSNDVANLQVFAVKDHVESPNVKFVIKNYDNSIYAETGLYEDVYNDERWNLQMSIKPQGYPTIGVLQSSQPKYTARLYGVTHAFGNVKHEFEITASANFTTGSAILCNSKRFYLGAHAQNNTGSVIDETDVIVDSLRVWMDELNNESIKAHNLDAFNYGHDKIYSNTTNFNYGISSSVEIPGYDSLILHWNFDKNSSANSLGEFTVQDFSSGSAGVEIISKATGIIEVVDVGGGLAKHASLPTTDGFTITDSDGNAIEYFFDNTGTKGASGTVTSDGVVVQINGITQAVLIASQIAIAIESSNGHGTNGTNTIKVLQRNPPNKNFIDLIHIKKGSQGNIAITPGSLPSDTIVFSGLTGGRKTVKVVGNKYGWVSNIIERENLGRALGFPSNDTNPVKLDFIYSRRKELPEISFTNDRISIFDNEMEYFLEDEDTTDNIFALEKSMYQSISDEMIRTFSSMKELANLFTKPVDYYRMEYKKLRTARGLFFERVTGNPDLDRYTDYFKWIDSSLSFFIEQLKPASVTFTKNVSNVVESHIFERPKYDRKFPTVNKVQATVGTIQSIGPLTYNWKVGHSPEYKNGSENDHSLWQKERSERLGPLASEIQTVQEVVTTETVTYNKYLLNNDGGIYLKPTYTLRRFSRPYKLSFDVQSTIHSGINYNQNKNRDFVYDVLRPHGSKTNLGVPVNVAVVGVGPGQGIVNTNISNDVLDPNQVDEYNFVITVGKDSSNDGNAPSTASLDYIYKVKGHYAAPFNLISGSEPRGANKKVFDNYSASVVLTNLHSDTTYLQNDIPLQGPFAETWVGGHQSRHVPVNRHDTNLKTEGGAATLNNLDDQYSRPEAYRILFGEHPDESVKDGALGLVGPDYGGPYPDPSRQWAIYYRGFRAKRPYNIQNISGSERVQGNYKEKYEYFNTVGRLENNNRLKKAASDANYQISGNFLPTDISTTLPVTTHPLTLIGSNTSDFGNYFGSGITSRAMPKRISYPRFTIATASSLTDNHYLNLTLSVGNVFGQVVHPLADQVGGYQKTLWLDTDGNPKTQDFNKLFNLYTYRKTFRSPNTFTADATGSLSGLNTDNFSISWWMKTPVNELSNTAHIGFKDDGDTWRHQIFLDNDIQIYFENSANAKDETIFDTNNGSVSGSQWVHYVAVFEVDDLSSATKVPRLYQNGHPVTSSGTTYSPVGGTTPQINEFIIRNDDKITLQDIVIWKTLLTGSGEIAELYNNGNWKDPSTHSKASTILSWWKYGDESYWDTYHYGYEVSGGLHNHHNNRDKFLSSSFGTHNNTLRIPYDQDHRFYFTKGLGYLTNTEIWDQAQRKLEHQFKDFEFPYVSGSERAIFTIKPRKDYHSTTARISISASNHVNPSFTVLSNTTAIEGPLNLVQRESDFLTGSQRNKTVIASRFSAPGGPEVQSYGYLDAYAREYSVHNSLNYRNLSIRGSGSGESGTIRANSQINTRDGLRALYQRPMGRSGTDGVYGLPDQSDYAYSASFHKIPRNTLVRPIATTDNDTFQRKVFRFHPTDPAETYSAIQVSTYNDYWGNIDAVRKTTKARNEGWVGFSYWVNFDKLQSYTTSTHEIYPFYFGVNNSMVTTGLYIQRTTYPKVGYSMGIQVNRRDIDVMNINLKNFLGANDPDAIPQGDAPIQFNKWYHIAFFYRKELNAEPIIYINGVSSKDVVKPYTWRYDSSTENGKFTDNGGYTGGGSYPNISYATWGGNLSGISDADADTTESEFSGMIADTLIWWDLPEPSTIEYLYKNPNADVLSINESYKIQAYFTLGENIYKEPNPLNPGTFVSNFDSPGNFYKTGSIQGYSFGAGKEVEYAKVWNVDADYANRARISARDSIYDITGSTQPQRLQLVTAELPRHQPGSIIGEKNNNYNYNSVLPASDYNYSWVTSSLGNNYSVRSGVQKMFGYWPKDGLNKINDKIESAITFPSSSEIYATYGE